MRFFARCTVARRAFERIGPEARALPAGLLVERAGADAPASLAGAVGLADASDSGTGAGDAGAGADAVAGAFDVGAVTILGATGEDAAAGACNVGVVTIFGTTGVGAGAFATEVTAEVTVLSTGAGWAGGGEVTVTGRADVTGRGGSTVVTGTGGSAVVTGTAGTVTVAVTPGSGGSPSASACAAPNPARAATTQKSLPKRDIENNTPFYPRETMRGAGDLLGLGLVLRDRIGRRHRIGGHGHACSRRSVRGWHRLVRVVAGVGMIMAGMRVGVGGRAT